MELRDDGETEDLQKVVRQKVSEKMEDGGKRRQVRGVETK